MKMDMPYFATASASVTLKAEPVSLEFLCSFRTRPFPRLWKLFIGKDVSTTTAVQLSASGTQTHCN